MKKEIQRNLTEGPIFQVLMRLALPIMLSAFLATAYNLTDMAWIGMLGSRAVAGVGVGGMYVWLSQGLASLARMGGQVYVGQCLGKEEVASAKKYAAAALQLAVLFGVLFGIVCVVFPGPLVSFFGLTDASSIAYGETYLQITCGVIVFSYVNAVLTGLYTAQGDSATPLKANFVGLLFNMLMDPILIFGVGPFPRMEVIGAAVATVAAQVIVTLYFILTTIRCAEEENILRKLSLIRLVEAERVWEVIRLGGPTALQGTLYCGISMVLTRMVAGFGEAAVATQRVGGQIECICWNIADGFAAALNAFTAQNYGAGKMERIKQGFRFSAWTVAAWGSFIMILFWLFPWGISGLFFHEAEALEISAQYLVILALGEPFMCVELTAAGGLSGLGSTKLCSLISIVLTGLRIPVAFLLSSSALGLDGIWWTFTLTSILKGIVFYIAFGQEWKRKEGVPKVMKMT